ncbi:MAG: hypothetical protein ABJ056_15020 [Halioglobus sp.]
MIKIMCVVGAALLVFSTTGVTADKYDKSKSKNSSSIFNSISDSDKQKSKGRPDDPGQHGRDNAAAKQRENPGNGSKGEESWLDSIRDKDDRDDDYERNKDKDKKKQKSKDKKK